MGEPLYSSTRTTVTIANDTTEIGAAPTFGDATSRQAESAPAAAGGEGLNPRLRAVIAAARHHGIELDPTVPAHAGRARAFGCSPLPMGPGGRIVVTSAAAALAPPPAAAGWWAGGADA